MINPQVVFRSKEMEPGWEGCASVQNSDREYLRGIVRRHSAMTVIYLDEKGHGQRKELDGFPARVFQHEYDHLDGILFVDRVQPPDTVIPHSEFLKRTQNPDVGK